MQRRQFEDNCFMKNGAFDNSLNWGINNTPIRTREDGLGNKQNSLIHQNRLRGDSSIHLQKDGREGRDNRFQAGNAYMNQLKTNNTKTVARRRQPSSGKNCVNHSQAEAEFKIMIDSQVFIYCNKCAAHLASNGFQVDRIAPASKSPKRMQEPTNSQYPTHSPSGTSQAKRKTQLNSFIRSLLALQDNYKHKDEYLQRVSLSYEVEKQTIGNYFASMTEYIEYIRDQHLKRLDQQSLRNSQICEIQSAEIGETLQQIELMREDIESNVENIIHDVDDSSYNECMSFYSQKHGLHQHRLEELGMEVKFAKCTTAEEIEYRLDEFKSFFDELTETQNSKIASSVSDY